MNFVKHSNLEGQHAFLGASTYHWINYTEEKVADAYAKYRAAQRGTVLHSFAAQCIKLGQRLPKSQKDIEHVCQRCNRLQDDAGTDPLLFPELLRHR